VGVAEILAQIDREISQLQRARALLDEASSDGSRVTVSTSRKAMRKKRNLTPEGRKRIAEAVKRRWAEQRRTASGK
jgi:hypothetical protein